MPRIYVFTTLNPRPLLGRPKGEVEMRKVEMVGIGRLESPRCGRNRGLATEWCGEENKEKNHTRDGVVEKKR